jgi:37-kD nucleoid-associated bacterial protein
MALLPVQSGCAVEIAGDLLAANDADFVAQSRKYPDKLTVVQTARNIPGGVIMVFTGEAGNPPRNIVGIVKAETHSGFRHTPTLQVQYLQDLFMGPQTKLFKIGVFLYDGTTPTPALPGGWEAVVYDKQMTPKNRDGAATYFYESFLGCTLPVNSAHLTRKFFESTREFINSNSSISDETKSDLLTGLYTYLKIDQSSTVEVATFSSQYLGPLKGDYETFMSNKSFPTIAVSKDTSEIQNYLRKRKLKFSRDLQLVGPPDAFADLVQVRSVQGDTEIGGERPTWTQITIRDRVRDQE